MSVTAFGLTASNNASATEIQAQPDNETVIIRSDNTGDTSQTLTLYGSATRTASLAGKREVKASGAMTEITSFKLSAAAAGIVRIYRPGTAGDGDIRFNEVPADGETFVLGLAGFTQTYTLRRPGRVELECLATAALAQGDYLDVEISVAISTYTWRVWVNIDGAGTGAPSAPGSGTLVQWDIASGNTADQNATSLAALLHLIDSGTETDALVASASTDTVTVTRVALGTLVVTDGASATGFTITSISGGTAPGLSAKDVRTGWTSAGAACTTDDIAGFALAAINAGSGGGINYVADAHPEITAISATGAVCSFQDRIAIDRLLEWDNGSTSTANVDIRTPVNGTTGDLIAEISAGNVGGYGDLSFDNETLAENDNQSIPAGILFTTDSIATGGRACKVKLAYPAFTGGITIKVLTSTNDATWHYTGSDMALDNSNGAGDPEDPSDTPDTQDFGPTEYIAFEVTANTASAAVPLCAKVTY